MERVRIRDAAGSNWEGVEVDLPSNGNVAGACRVPWWVSLVNICRASPGDQRLLFARRHFTAPRYARDDTAHPAPMALAVGENLLWLDVGRGRGGACLRVVREEALKGPWLSKHFTDYEISQLHLWLFFSAACLSLWFRVPSLLAAPTLAIIPITRVCPEVSQLVRSSQSGTSPGGAKVIAIIVLLCTFFGYRFIATLQDTYADSGVFKHTSDENATTRLAGHGDPFVNERWSLPLGWMQYVDASSGDPYYCMAAFREACQWERPLRAIAMEPASISQVNETTNCSSLPGINCQKYLSAWAGPGNCSVLAYTDGTCKAYCERFNHTCMGAADDIGTGACAIDAAGQGRQSASENGCLQSWRTQICICKPPTVTAVGLHPAIPPPPPRRVQIPSPPKSATPPVKEGHMPEEQYAERPVQISPCYVSGAAHLPLNMPGSVMTRTVDAAQCQAVCDRTIACARFTWFPPRHPPKVAAGSFSIGEGNYKELSGGACNLQEFGSQLKTYTDAITGPANCKEEEGLASIRREEPFWLRFRKMPDTRRGRDDGFAEVSTNRDARSGRASFQTPRHPPKVAAGSFSTGERNYEEPSIVVTGDAAELERQAAQMESGADDLRERARKIRARADTRPAAEPELDLSDAAADLANTVWGTFAAQHDREAAVVRSSMHFEEGSAYVLVVVMLGLAFVATSKMVD